MKNIKAFTGDIRKKVKRLENEMLKCEQVDIPVKNYFAHGLYAREVFIPAGTVVTGKIHKYSQINILSQGEISVVTESGVIRIKAPYTLVSPPGTKRAAYTHSDVIWTTIHATHETDIQKIEEHFIAKDEQEYLEFLSEQPCLG